MSKSVSFRDVIKCLKYVGKGKFNEVELLQKENDAVVLPILHELGIDVRKAVWVDAAKHRDMDLNVGIGFRYNGFMRIDREWAKSKATTLHERIAIAASRDISLAKEMNNLSGNSVSHVVTDDKYELQENDEFPPSLISETYIEDRAMIVTLNQLAVKIRGEQV